MKEKRDFDFWYAVNNTEIVKLPSNHLETFGSTVLNYHLVSELMDTVSQVRVREGRMHASKPTIITPEAYSETLLEGFGEEAQRYIEWLKKHESDVHILQYGYTLKQQSYSEHVVSENMQSVVERVKTEVSRKNDPLSAVLIGVDDPWDVCLIKLFVEIVRHSAKTNIQQLAQRHMFERVSRLKSGIHDEIEASFRTASKNPSLIKALGKKLQDYGVFDEYQDRFFALVKAAGSE